MDKELSSQIINFAGGDAAFAKLLRLTGKGVLQRINNWKRRGIPSRVVNDHYAKIRKLEKQISRAA